MKDIRTIIEEELLENDEEVLIKFKTLLSNDINDFIGETVKAYNEWEKWDSKIGDNEQRAYISAYIFTAINTLVISTRLFIQGYSVPSGNLVRNAMESCAMAILCSNNQLPFFEKIRKNEFKVHRSISVIEKHAPALAVTKESFTLFKKHWSFYHEYSHATLFSISTQISFSQDSQLIIGAIFDNDKKEAYKKEIRIRIHIAKLLENIINGISDNIR